MPTTLTSPALKELEDHLKVSRRFFSEVYREYRVGSTVEEIAAARGKAPKDIREILSALRVLFGRKQLPKQGDGRQQAIYEADALINSDVELSPELEDHLARLLVKAEKTNRRADYKTPTVPAKRVTREMRRPRGERSSAVYVVTRKSYMKLAEVTGEPLMMKIGWSDSVWDRVSSAQTWDPEPIEVLRIFYCVNPNTVEAKLHVVLDTLGLRVEGGGGKEWFTADLDLIDSLAHSLGLEDAKEE